MTQAQEDTLLASIIVTLELFGGKPIIRGRRLTVEHVLGMLRLVGHERVCGRFRKLFSFCHNFAGRLPFGAFIGWQDKILGSCAWQAQL